MIGSIIHRFFGMSPVVFNSLYRYRHSFAYPYFDITPQYVRRIIIYRYPANPLYHYQHNPVYSYSDITPYVFRHIIICRYPTNLLYHYQHNPRLSLFLYHALCGLSYHDISLFDCFDFFIRDLQQIRFGYLK